MRTRSNKYIKVQMLQSILKDVLVRKTAHYSRYASLKKWSGCLKATITGSNAISVCSLVVSLVPDSPTSVIIALVATSTSAILSAVITAYELENKIHSHKTSYLQYQDVQRDMWARLYRNGLSSDDLDGMLAELNARLGLVDDSSLPVPNMVTAPQSMPVPISPKDTNNERLESMSPQNNTVIDVCIDDGHHTDRSLLPDVII